MRKCLYLVIIILILAFWLPYFISKPTLLFFKNILMFVTYLELSAIFRPYRLHLLATAAYGAGIYTAAYLGDVLPLPVMVLCGGVASFLLALIIGAITLRLRGIYFAIFTLSSVELIKHVLHWIEITVLGKRGRPVVKVSDSTVFYVILIIVVLLLVTTYFLIQSHAMSSISRGAEYRC